MTKRKPSAPPPVMTPEKLELICDLREQGKSLGVPYAEIGRRLGRKNNSIRGRLTALANREACAE